MEVLVAELVDVLELVVVLVVVIVLVLLEDLRTTTRRL